jgi:spore maturation protein CgeB
MLSDNFNVDIYTGSDTSSMPNIHNKGFADSLQQMPIIFNQSKINLNITSKSIRSGLPLRIFDVLGCQGFLITNYQAEIPEIFEIGKDLVTYDSMQDLKDKCHYYLTHNQERIEIAQNGYEKVKKLHTYDVRLTEILKLSFRL